MITEAEAKRITRYLDVQTVLSEQPDLVFVFGTRHPEPAQVAADLIKRGMGRFLVLTGGKNPINGMGEALTHLKIVLGQGVERERVIVESESTNTLENVVFAIPKITERVTLAAWEPVFHSLEHVLGHGIFALLWPDWRDGQAKGVASACKDRVKYTTLVAEVDGVAAGFLAYTLKHEEKTGYVDLLAVHPDYQNRGVGTALNTAALEQIRESGMKLAIVETGGDPGHAPARRAYEKAGYTLLPSPVFQGFDDIRKKSAESAQSADEKVRSVWKSKKFRRKCCWHR